MEVNDNETLNFDIDDLFKDPEEEKPQEPKSDDANKDNKNEASDITKGVSKRINEVRAATEKETRDAVAKEAGYENYEALQKAKEKQILKDAGLNDEDIEPVVQKLLNKRLAEDPRMKKLEEFEAREKANFVKEQLKEINKFAGTGYKDVSELPQEVISMWEKTGNLKQAYLAIQGENLIGKNIAGKQNGTLSHLANPGSVGTSAKERPLTEAEKDMWRMVIPDITDDELSKKTMPIE